ncbi:MAG: hypothetical protein CM15mP120_02120 [Pseudomonadota bacterium]|nr:MAG: hypothetical protein CM15mP120_02120 [Pseudomonadota bacterium]
MLRISKQSVGLPRQEMMQNKATPQIEAEIAASGFTGAAVYQVTHNGFDNMAGTEATAMAQLQPHDSDHCLEIRQRKKQHHYDVH